MVSTGKSFFLNQLSKKRNGFKVGRTTESCTRGIWLWDAGCTSGSGDRVVFMDTEGMSALDNDETYDAKIFSLGLLLSSLFVFNSMGVIDESAMDRLFLVSELTKHVCVQTNGQGENSDEEEAKFSEEMLAPYFPPFVWLLRDFMLDMQENGQRMTANEYLESALEIRTSGGNSRRIQERNRIRVSLKALFKKRQCLTLVRPITDEEKLRNASALGDDELRPEFIEQIKHIRTTIFSTARPKKMFNQLLDGTKLAHLVEAYTKTMNDGSIPDIKGAWEYVSEASCLAAEQKATACYDAGMEPVCTQEPPVSQAEFDASYRKYQEEAVKIFKTESVDGSCRQVCFQRLKEYIQGRKTIQTAHLQERSKSLCQETLTSLSKSMIINPIKENQIENMAQFQIAWNAMLEAYDERAAGPAVKHILLGFLKTEIMELFQYFSDKTIANHQNDVQTREAEHQSTQNALNTIIQQVEGQVAKAEMDNIRLEETKSILQERLDESASNLEIAKQTERELREKIDSNLKVMDDVRDNLTKMQEHKVQAEKDRDAIENQRDRVQAQLENKMMEFDALELKSQTDLQQLQTESESKLHSKKEKIACLKQNVQELQESSTSLQIQMEHASSSISKLKQEYENSTHELSNSRADLQVANVNIAELNDALTNVQSSFELLHQEKMETENHLNGEIHNSSFELAKAQDMLESMNIHLEIQKCLDDCVFQILQTTVNDKGRAFSEERNVLQERLGELYTKIATLPDFYQRQIFCAEAPQRSFFDALTLY